MAPRAPNPDANAHGLASAHEAHHIPSVALREAMQQSPSLHAALMKYVQALMVQTAHTAIATPAPPWRRGSHAGC
jgi:hypothetical protein